MSDSISRRTLIKTSAVLGASALLAGNSMGLIQGFAHAAGKPDVAAVTGNVVDALGVIGRFAGKQSREGVIGTMGDARVFVFRYRDKRACDTIFDNASGKIAASNRYSEVERREDQIAMVGRDRNSVIVLRAGQHIVAVIGDGSGRVESTAGQLVMKLKDA